MLPTPVPVIEPLSDGAVVQLDHPSVTTFPETELATRVEPAAGTVFGKIKVYPDGVEAVVFGVITTLFPAVLAKVSVPVLEPATPKVGVAENDGSAELPCPVKIVPALPTIGLTAEAPSPISKPCAEGLATPNPPFEAETGALKPIVNVPPSDKVPPPVIPVPLLIVILELASCAFGIEASVPRIPLAELVTIPAVDKPESVSPVKVGELAVPKPMSVLAAVEFARVTAPVLLMVASPLMATGAACPELLPTQMSVLANVEPVGEVPVIVVLVTPVTRPCASVVSTGTVVDEPYVPAVPVFFNDRTPAEEMVASPLMVASAGAKGLAPVTKTCPAALPLAKPWVIVPPKATVPPPVIPVPLAMVTLELLSCAFGIEASVPSTPLAELVTIPAVDNPESVSPVKVGELAVPKPISVLAAVEFARVTAPVLLMVASPLIATGAACPELLPTQISVLANVEPVGEVPVIVVLVTPVTRPCASVVSTGTVVDEPYVPAVPVFFKAKAPVEEIVASPLMATGAAIPEPFPTQISVLGKAVDCFPLKVFQSVDDK
jgi:hypothetical protein